MGLETMKQFDLDTCVCDSSISWSKELVMPMVSLTFWTKEPLIKMIESLNTTHADPVLQEIFAQEIQSLKSQWIDNQTTIPHFQSLVI